jgi:putative oxidoreductase
MVVGFFRDLGIPWPEFQAPLVAGVELGCGILIAVGLATRLACVPLIITMVVAILTALREQIGSIVDLLALSEATYIAVMVWLVAVGPGAASFDALLMRFAPRSSDTSPAGATSVAA